MGSTRLPGKVLTEIAGKSVLERQIDRLRRSLLVDQIVVATSTNVLDDAIEELCERLDIAVFRGPENDVLDRLARLFDQYPAEINVECFGDSPLVDPSLVDSAIREFRFRDSQVHVDYLSSAIETTFPPGLEVTVHRVSSLIAANRLVSPLDPLREHAGYNISRFPQHFRVESLIAPPSLRHPQMFLELDTAEDLAVIRSVIEYFLRRDVPHPTAEEIVEYMLEHPEIRCLNSRVPRRWEKLRKTTDV